MKKTVTLSTYVDLEGHIDEIISNLRNLQDEYENKYINLRIDSAYVYDDSKTFQLVGDREETEEETILRCNEEKANSDRQKEQELKILADLKKKYE